MNDVDRYLASLPDDARAALENLRKVIRSVVPNAEEKISYRMPTIVHYGLLVSSPRSKTISACSF